MSKKIIILKLLPEESYCIDMNWKKDTTQYYGYIHGDWDPEDWKEAHSGDEFFLIQYKDNSTGIIMHGTLHSDAMRYGTWPGTEQGIYGTHLISDLHIDDNKYRLLTTDTLQAAMPTFQWNALHSGRPLPAIYADKFHHIWNEYLSMNDVFTE